MLFNKDQCKIYKDDENIINYPRSSIPLISEYLKNSLTIFFMIIIFSLQLVEYKLFYCQKNYKGLWIRNFYVLSFFILVKIVNSITNFYIENSDFLLIIFIISSMLTFNEMLNKFIYIIIKSKEILIFWFLMILSFTCLSRILFFDIENFESGKSFYFSYNFKNFHSSLYSMLIMISLNNFPNSMLHAYKINKFFFLFFLCYIIFNTIIIINMITAIFNYNFSSLYQKYIKFMGKQPILSNKIKQEIHYKRLNNELLLKILKSYCKDRENRFKDLDIDYHFQNIKNKQSDTAKNLSINILLRLIKLKSQNKFYIIFYGMMDLINIAITIAVVDNKIHFYYFYITLFLSTIIMFDLMISFLIFLNNLDKIWEKIPFFIDWILNLIMIFICIFFIIYKDDNILEDFKNIINLLTILCNLRFQRIIKFIFLYKEIKYIFKILFKILKFLIDLLFILIMLYFIFSTLSISFYGGLVNNSTIVNYKKKFNSEITESQLNLNFNDYMNAYFTLDYIRKTGWIEAMMINLTNKQEENYLNIYFFVLFFFIMNFCLYPIITGFILDNLFSYLSDIIEKKDDSDIEKIVNNLQNFFLNKPNTSKNKKVNINLEINKDDMDKFINE